MYTSLEIPRGLPRYKTSDNPTISLTQLLPKYGSGKQSDNKLIQVASVELFSGAKSSLKRTVGSGC
uniref:Uncharacterized protein n=1 Tax=Anguilla anguilla TaxID=7936 RepID=A0A0E9V634_ANGAN